MPFTAQITRGDAEALDLQEGDTVYVAATRVPAMADGSPARSEGVADEGQSTLTSA
jgi:sulfate transport system ATP-binding protein